jgi:pimeloyl-ACP methyl ester carboxylesterase
MKVLLLKTIMKLFKKSYRQFQPWFEEKTKDQNHVNRRGLLRALLLGAGITAAKALPAEALSAEPKRRIPSRPFIRANDGTNLFYQDWGNGKPILFVAPWALNSGWWEYQIPYLSSQGFRCIAYDRRGHGRSDHPAYGYDFNTLSDDLAHVVNQLDLHDITLVGHSMGCGEVVRYLSQFGAQRVKRLVLIATITPFTLRTPDNPEGVEWSDLESGRIKLRKDRPHQLSQAAAGFFGSPKNPVSDEIMQWWTRMMVDQCSMKTMLDLHSVFTETDFRPDLRKIKVPTLLIHGDIDTSTDIDFTSRRTVPLIANSVLKVYEGAAHGLPVTHMEKLNADLMAFAKS